MEPDIVRLDLEHEENGSAERAEGVGGGGLVVVAPERHLEAARPACAAGPGCAEVGVPSRAAERVPCAERRDGSAALVALVGCGRVRRRGGGRGRGCGAGCGWRSPAGVGRVEVGWFRVCRGGSRGQCRSRGGGGGGCERGGGGGGEETRGGRTASAQGAKLSGVVDDMGVSSENQLELWSKEVGLRASEGGAGSRRSRARRWLARLGRRPLAASSLPRCSPRAADKVRTASCLPLASPPALSRHSHLAANPSHPRPLALDRLAPVKLVD